MNQFYLWRVFSYHDGKLIRRPRSDRTPQWNGRYANTIAGCATYFEGKLYITINQDGRVWLGHRLVWLYHYGYLPEQIDHKDGDGINNRIQNLREATQSQNNANIDKLQRGVEQRGNSFRARIKVDGNTVQLGSYSSYNKAQQAYNIAADKYFGAFARCNRDNVQ